MLGEVVGNYTYHIQEVILLKFDFEMLMIMWIKLWGRQG